MTTNRNPTSAYLTALAKSPYSHPGIYSRPSADAATSSKKRMRDDEDLPQGKDTGPIANVFGDIKKKFKDRQKRINHELARAVKEGKKLSEEEVSRRIESRKQKQKEYQPGGQISRPMLKKMVSLLKKNSERSVRLYNFAKLQALPQNRRAQTQRAVGKQGSVEGGSNGGAEQKGSEGEQHEGGGEKFPRSWVKMVGIGGLPGYVREVKSRGGGKIKYLKDRRQCVMPEASSEGLEAVRTFLRAWAEICCWTVTHFRGCSACPWGGGKKGKTEERSEEELRMVVEEASEMSIMLEQRGANAAFGAQKRQFEQLRIEFDEAVNVCGQLKANPREAGRRGRLEEDEGEGWNEDGLGSDDENEVEFGECDEEMGADGESKLGGGNGGLNFDDVEMED